MRILHVLDHSLPLHSGYTFRTAAILREQRALGWETLQLTTPRQQSGADVGRDVDGWRFHRTPLAPSAIDRVPGASYVREMRGDGAAPRCAGRDVPARRPACAFAGAERAAGAVGRPAARHAGRLRGARALGGRRGRPRHDARRQPALPRLAGARDATRCAAPTTSRRSAKGCAARSSARGIPRERVTVIPNAVDTDDIPVRRRCPMPRCARSSASTARRSSDSSARSTPTKASILLIEALAALAPRARTCACCWSAAGRRKQRCARQVARAAASPTGSSSPDACRTARCSATTS